MTKNLRMVFGVWIFPTLFIVLAIYNANCNSTPTSLEQNESIFANLTRIRRQATGDCPRLQQKCESGECLGSDLFCDGKEDCRDGSDETKKSCGDNNCPGLAFRCAYGGCVPGDVTCDKKRDCADNSDELLPECSNKENSNKCGQGKFTCDNGECIESYDTCDGKKDCGDGSDETVKVCASADCDSRFFRCEYGACVDGGAKCNGRIQCVDGSDESPELCGGAPSTGTSRPITPISPGSTVGCVLPPKPKHGQYTVNGQNNYVPGNLVGPFTSLDYSCSKSYQLNSVISDVRCSSVNGKYVWNRPIPDCLLTCGPLQATTLSIKCSLNGLWADCSKPVLPETIADIKCKEKHTAPFVNGIIPPPYSRSTCRNGQWDRSLIQCQPVCGRRVPQGTPYIIGGKNVTNLAEFPWHVGIYYKTTNPKKGVRYSQSCGGSIISPKVIVTAAHCFENGIDPQDYGIGAGKYYRKWDEKLDDYAQLKMVKEIKIPSNYKGKSSTYAHDIAVIIIIDIFTITDLVAPICIDWPNKYESQALRDKSTGWVSGWGLTAESGDSSTVLKQIELRYVPYQECYDKSTADFQPFVGLDDKLCAGRDDGQNVCEGDSGGGFVIAQDGVFYLRGIVSIGPPKAGSCDASRFATFTKLTTEHLAWVNEIFSNNSPI